jgi:hypothetical protein
MRSHLFRLTILLTFAALPLVAQPTKLKTHPFGGHEWSIQLPADYIDERKATPDERTQILVFRPNPRADGSRPMLHVMTMEISAIPGAMKSKEFFDVFVKRVVGEIEKRHDQWKVSQSEVTVGGRKMSRFAWSGVPRNTTPAVPARGVILIGEDGHVAFMLHSQDAAKYADQSVTAGEQAMRTFELHDKH